MHLVGLLIYTLQYDARCIQRQIEKHCISNVVGQKNINESSQKVLGVSSIFVIICISIIYHFSRVAWKIYSPWGGRRSFKYVLLVACCLESFDIGLRFPWQRYIKYSGGVRSGSVDGQTPKLSFLRKIPSVFPVFSIAIVLNSAVCFRAELHTLVQICFSDCTLKCAI